MRFHPLIHPDIPNSHQMCPETALPYYTSLGWVDAPPPPPPVDDDEVISVVEPVVEPEPAPEPSTPDAPAETPSPANRRGSRASKED